jgi:hypothetical protein
VGAKRPGREADHSPPSSAELYLHSPIHFHGVVLSKSTGTALPFYFTFYLVKHRDYFIFTFTFKTVLEQTGCRVVKFLAAETYSMLSAVIKGNTLVSNQTSLISLYLQLTERGHFRSTLFKLLCT